MNNQYNLISYNDLSNLGRYPIPYFIYLGKHKQYLYYFGTRHSYTPEDSQFSVLRHYFTDFRSAANDSKKLVLVEGAKPNVKLYSDIDDAIKKNAEVGFISYLAHEHQVDFACPEPDRKTEADSLLEDYTPKEVMTFYTNRCLYSISRRSVGMPENIESFMERFYSSEEKLMDWQSTHFTFDMIKASFKKIVGKDLDIQNIDMLRNLNEPLEDGNLLNKIGARSSQIRDNYIISQIEDYWKKDISLFIVYGRSHAIMHEPAIRQIVENS